MDHLESFIAECDRRTELAKKRLAETQEEISAEVSAKVCLGDINICFFFLTSPHKIGNGGKLVEKWLVCGAPIPQNKGGRSLCNWPIGSSLLCSPSFSTTKSLWCPLLSVL